jgi:hypothetical protein
MGVTARDRSLCDGQGCLVVPGVRSDHEVSELRERIDRSELWDGAPGSTSHSLDLIRTVCCPTNLFASRLHQSVGPFAQNAGPSGRVFAQSAGRHKPLFASPRVPVRKPLHL